MFAILVIWLFIGLFANRIDEVVEFNYLFVAWVAFIPFMPFMAHMFGMF